MIKINPANLQAIKNEFYNGVGLFTYKKIEFLTLLFRVCQGYEPTSNLQIFKLHGKVKNSLIKFVINNPINVKASNYQNYNSITILKNFYRTNLNDLNTFLTYLITGNNLKNLLLCLPKDLLNEENKVYASSPLQTNIQKDFLNKIFDYREFERKNSSYFNAYDLTQALNFNVCAYCNRQFINTVVKSSEIIRPTLDHFHSQSNHPLLALSFYNLIPSCYSCNSNIKGNSNLNISDFIHPYEDEYGDKVRFTYKFIRLHEDISNPKNFEIAINNNHPVSSKEFSKVRESISFFKIKEIYQSHTDIVGEIYLKCEENSLFYVKDLIERHKGLKASVSEIYKYFFCNYYNESDFSQRILSKLTRDIVDEFGIFDRE